jgi:hypothetical protein
MECDLRCVDLSNYKHRRTLDAIDVWDVKCCAASLADLAPLAHASPTKNGRKRCGIEQTSKSGSPTVDAVLADSFHRAEPLPIRRWPGSRWLAAPLLLVVAACSHLGDTSRLSEPGHPSEVRKVCLDERGPRAQLSIGYSMLYREADGIPKLKWILMFKDKPQDMGRLTDDLMSYYQQLAETLRRLSTLYPAMRIDVEPMSEIEGDERKAIGEDLAKDLAPVIGRSGIDFEREALLAFHDALDEQRHLTEVMAKRETDPGLKKFLETTKTQLDEHYARVGALLNRRYFSH